VYLFVPDYGGQVGLSPAGGEITMTVPCWVVVGPNVTGVPSGWGVPLAPVGAAHHSWN
jgi:hypothetical protein